MISPCHLRSSVDSVLRPWENAKDEIRTDEVRVLPHAQCHLETPEGVPICSFVESPGWSP